MNQRITVLINEAGGTAKHAQAVADLRSLLAARLPEADVEMIGAGGDLTARVKAACAAGAQIVAAAGGDGSLNAAAQPLVGTDIRLGVLPFGTFNHFAHDLGVPIDLPAAVDLLSQGTARRVDVGAVNDRYYLNNASLGLYPELVELREHASRALSKPLRLVSATWQLIRKAKPLSIEIEEGGEWSQSRIWLIFVGNNFYHLGIFRPRYRTRLDAGKLDIFEVRARRRSDITHVVLSAFRRSFRLHNLVHRELAAITVRAAGAGRYAIAFDGEVVEMAPPFIFRSVPQALWVIAPPPP